MNLQTDDLRLCLSQDGPTYQLQSLKNPQLSLKASFSIEVMIEGRKLNLLSPDWGAPEKMTSKQETTPLGPIHQATLTANRQGLSVEISLGLWEGHPFAGIRMSIQNLSGRTVRVDSLTPACIKAGQLNLAFRDEPDPAFFSQGWQSWSTSRVYGLGQKQHTSILGPFQNPMVVNPGSPQPRSKNRFGGDMFGVLGDRRSRAGLLAGFLSQKEQFGSLEARLGPPPALSFWANGDNVRLLPGAVMMTDWAVLGFVDLDTPFPLDGYFQGVALAHDLPPGIPSPAGWCSWYHFYENVTAGDIHANLESLIDLQPSLPLPLLQIDDGFETRAGDWFDFDPGFPKGVRTLAADITSKGLTPGLWLAPFILHPGSNIAREHPDWLLRSRSGRPMTAGFVWNRFTRALDLTHPDALAYACEVVRTAVEDWGFKYLKLDFLYAAALEGVYQDPTLTRAQVLRRGLEALREAVGPAIPMLGCGCPLGSGLGIFEAMRIGADVSGYWEPHFPPFSPLLKKEPHMPSVRNALQNVLSRAQIHRQWWVNDPDCLLVRPDTGLTLAEIQTLATAIAMTGGSLLLSDDLPALPPKRLQIAQVLLPLIGQRPQVPGWFDESTPTKLRLDLDGPAGPWHLLSFFNWRDEPVDFLFDPGLFGLDNRHEWWARSFWTGRVQKVNAGAVTPFHDLPPHGVALLALRPCHPNKAAYLGSDLHISQGLEVTRFACDAPENLGLSLRLPHNANGQVVLYLPQSTGTTHVNDQAAPLKAIGEDVYTLAVSLVRDETLRIVCR
jgi:alpha-galactosidase